MASKGYAQAKEERTERIGQLREWVGEVFPEGVCEVLEMGCGHGHFLSAYAQAHPGARCLGVDLSGARIRRAERKAQRAGLDGLHFIRAEVGELMEALPERVRFGAFFMLFPDPWPKRRHHRNRMIQEALLGQLASHALPGAYFYFRSDQEDYLEWTRGHIEAHPDWMLDAGMAWPFECESVFQQLTGNAYGSLVARKL